MIKINILYLNSYLKSNFKIYINEVNEKVNQPSNNNYLGLAFKLVWI